MPAESPKVPSSARRRPDLRSDPNARRPHEAVEKFLKAELANKAYADALLAPRAAASSRPPGATAGTAALTPRCSGAAWKAARRL